MVLEKLISEGTVAQLAVTVDEVLGWIKSYTKESLLGSIATLL